MRRSDRAKAEEQRVKEIQETHKQSIELHNNHVEFKGWTIEQMIAMHEFIKISGSFHSDVVDHAQHG